MVVAAGEEHLWGRDWRAAGLPRLALASSPAVLAGARVILPLLAPSLAVAFIFRTISAVQVFDIPYTFIQQAPAQGLLETLGVYIYRTGIEFLDFGYAAALSVALFALSLAVTAVYVRFVRDGGNS